MVLHHARFIVSSLSASKKFYLEALAPLGYKEYWEETTQVGLTSEKGGPDLWLGAVKEGGDGPTKGLHLAFKAESRGVVDAFYDAALYVFHHDSLDRVEFDVELICRKAGAKDNGAPGVRKYGLPGYYAAFILDLDGNNIEAVHHD